MLKIYISNLSFSDSTFVEEVKLAVLCSSLIAGVLGFVLLRSTKR
ncbi:Na+/H+ antiporter NhaA [Empedobacter stercoris]